MPDAKSTRLPRQARSQRTKERILAAATKLFCERGFFQTTTNEIAAEAGLSIGSLYSYFVDREEILEDIAVGFDSNLRKALEEISAEVADCRSDFQLWLRLVIGRSVELRAGSLELYNELISVGRQVPRVAEILEGQRRAEKGIILQYLNANAGELRVGDLDAASFVVYSLIDSVIRSLTEKGEGRIESSSVVSAAAEAISRYLFV